MFGATNAFNPNTGYDLISRLLAIVILGGLGSLAGAMAAAVFILVINDVVSVWWSPTWAPLVYFAALVIVLSIQAAGPDGTHGGKSPVSERRRSEGRAGIESAATNGDPETGGDATTVEGAPAARRRPGLRAVGFGVWGVIALLFVLFPVLVSDPTTTSIAFFAVIFMVAAAAWNIFSGYTGYLALGHAVFFGSGGYALALLCQHLHVGGGWPSFALLPLCGIVAALIAVPVGLVSLRTRRHTFVVVTIAIFFIFQLAAFNVSFTGGTSGLFLPAAPWFGSSYNPPFYYVAVAILAITVVASWLVRRSRFGLQLLAIRDDEDRALGLGVQTRQLKLSAFVISALFVGMAGGLYFDFIGEVFPNTAYDPLFDLVDRVDGVLRRARHARRAAVRRARAGVAAAVPDAELLQQRDLSDRLRRAVPGGDPDHAARSGSGA